MNKPIFHPLSLYSILMMLFLAFGTFSSTGQISPKGRIPPNGRVPFLLVSSGDTILWIDWNIRFHYPVPNAVERHDTLIQIENRLTNFLSYYNSFYNVKYSAIDTILTCSCDPTLFNLQVYIALNGTGTTAPPNNNPPPQSMQGDTYSITENHTVTTPSANGTILYNDPILLKPKRVLDDSILAIIDTGIDSTLFQLGGTGITLSSSGGSAPANLGLGRIAWRMPGIEQLNFIQGENPQSNKDASPIRHGTTVAALALEAFSKDGIYPKVMVLKALDDSGIGTIFSTSCAIHFAVQHHARVINASFGYYDSTADPTLMYYVNEASVAKIHFIAAAGNSEGCDVCSAFLCSPLVNPANLLAKGPVPRLNHLFWPACFSHGYKMTNVTTVTGLSKYAVPCFYQNYSDSFVSVGIQHDSTKLNCCTFKMPYMNVFHTGSSFEAPIVAGYFMYLVLHNNSSQGIPTIANLPGVQLNFRMPFQQLNKTIPWYTVNGSYLVYTGNY